MISTNKAVKNKKPEAFRAQPAAVPPCPQPGSQPSLKGDAFPWQRAQQSRGEHWLLVRSAFSERTWIPESDFHIYISWQIFAHLYTGNFEYGWQIRVQAGMAASGSRWGCAIAVAMLSHAGQIGWKDIAALPPPRRSCAAPFLQITSAGLLFNETDRSITNGTRLNALYNIAGGKTTDFSGLRSSTVYGLIIKKEGYVSQNMALWAKAVFLCSLKQQNVALHLRPIILHRFSETDKTYKMSDDRMTAHHSTV